MNIWMTRMSSRGRLTDNFIKWIRGSSKHIDLVMAGEMQRVTCSKNKRVGVMLGVMERDVWMTR